MEIKDIAQGLPVFIVAEVLNIHGREAMPVETHSVTLRLADGQAVTTNVRNLVERQAPAPVEQATADAIAAVRAESERAVAEADTAVSDALVKYADVIKERDEWKAKAEAAETVARELAVDRDAWKAKATPSTKKKDG